MELLDPKRVRFNLDYGPHKCACVLNALATITGDNYWKIREARKQWRLDRGFSLRVRGTKLLFMREYLSTHPGVLILSSEIWGRRGHKWRHWDEKFHGVPAILHTNDHTFVVDSCRTYDHHKVLSYEECGLMDKKVQEVDLIGIIKGSTSDTVSTTENFHGVPFRG